MERENNGKKKKDAVFFFKALIMVNKSYVFQN
jgi:hypothetical protein